MSEKKTKLELTWIGKEHRPRLEPRILLEDRELSYQRRMEASSDLGIVDNILIQGDNLLALKAIEQEFVGQIKCIMIDPPYNTGSAFTHYDDGLEHSIWLSLMRDRLEIIYRLLGKSGTLWISVDDNESHYLKVLCDELFGRANFIANVVWQKKYAPANDAKWLSDDHDHILVYAKNKETWRPNLLARTEDQDALYSNPDGDSRGPWMSDNYTCAKTSDERPNLYYAVRNPNTNEEIWPKRSRVWAFDLAAHQKHVAENRIWWGKDGTNSTPRLKKFRNELKKAGRVCSTIWSYQEVGHNQDAKREAIRLNSSDPFSTPKPEQLLERILTLATVPGDIVLDSFAGSGTTGAVAHKMGRRWIMIELGSHCSTHIIPRLKAVIDGTDPGGITESVGWKGGGGFRFCHLAPSLLERDRWGNWVIAKSFNKEMLAEAMCKLEGFRYAPSQSLFWQHGQSTERDFIYVTTQTLTHEQLQSISDEVGPERTLLICCSAFRAKVDAFPNLTVKKIPAAVLSRCEWRKDDYSLNVKNVMGDSEESEPDEPPKAKATGTSKPVQRRRKKVTVQELSLFAPRGDK